MQHKLILVFCILLCDQVRAQELIDEDRRHGLLGHRYLSGQLVLQRPFNTQQPLYDYDATATVNLNLPVRWIEENMAVFSQDVFFSASNLNPFQNETRVGRVVGYDIFNLMNPDSSTVPTSLDDAESSTNTVVPFQARHPTTQYFSTGRVQGYRFQVGTTLFNDFRNDVRPFVQLGYSLNITTLPNGSVEFGSNSEPHFRRLPGSTRDFGHHPICNLGVEWDLGDRVTLRPQVDLGIGSGDILRYSTLSSQLIWRFNQELFLSTAVLCATDGSMPGGAITLGYMF